MIDWEAERQRLTKLRELELLIASPAGDTFREIKRLKAGNEKLRRKLEKILERKKSIDSAN